MKKASVTNRKSASGRRESTSVTRRNSPRRARQLFRGLIVAVAFGALVSVPLLSRYTRTVQAVGDVSLNTMGVAATQNFDTLATAGTANTWTDGTTLPGWYAQFSATPANPTTYRASTGTDTTGAIYSFGVAGTNALTERAFGSISSGTPVDIYYAVKLTNNTGQTITSLLISYNGEQWRDGGNATPALQKLDFQYQVANAGTITDANTPSTGWSDYDPLDFTGPKATTTAGALDGNAAANRTAKSALLSLNVPNGQEIWLRWKDINDTGNDHGLAIDDFSVTPFGALGTTGYRTTDIQGTDDGGYAMVIQPDNKIVVGGYAVNGSGNKDFALARYNYDGTLDSTFGTGGKVTTDFNGTSDRIWGLALQSDGKIVAVGETVSLVFPGTNDIALARYNSNGTLDSPGFGGTGKVTTDHGGGANNTAYAVAISGTNIIVAGSEQVSGNLNFMVAQYTNLGVLDPLFGTGGVTTLDFSGFNDVARAVAIDSSSRIVLGGYSNSGTNDDFAVARFTSAGILDTTFVGGLGKIATDLATGGINSADQAFAMAIIPGSGLDAGKILLAGSSFNNTTHNKDFAVTRYLSTGALDTGGFGPGTGCKTIDFNNSPDVAQAIFARADGSFVVGGFSRSSLSSDDFAVASCNSSGGPDLTFNGTGRLTFTINNEDDRIYGIAQGADGKITAAGFATVVGSNPVQHDFAIARFSLIGVADASGTPPSNSPDLLLEKTGPLNPSTAIAGTNFTYILTVTNRGTQGASNVVITDPLPAAVTFVSATSGAINNNGTVTKNVGFLNAGASSSFQITVTASNTPQLVSNTATATLNETDPTPGNNSATEVTRIIGLTDLSFNPGTVTGGCQNTTGTVTLSGEAPFGGATVTLQSNDPSAASCPASVTVLQGQTSANFQVTTSPVVSNKQVRFQADLGPTTFVRRINVNAGVCN